MRRLLIAFGVIAVLGLVVGGVAVQHVRGYLYQPIGGSKPVTILVARGATLKKVLDDLAGRGVLTQPDWLYYYARYTKETEVLAGEYEITPKDTPVGILAMLRAGRVKLESFTVPEGLDRWQVRDLLVSAHWMTAEKFDRLCDDAKFLNAHNVPGPTCEGYLFPETYTFARGVAAEKILGEMFATFNRVVAELTRESKGPMGFGPLKMATLASIVEKETGAAEERPRIACVFYNRLQAKTKWRMDTDPSVIYAAKLADPNFDGNLTREHLRKLDSPYNTYRIIGLPPGPIANPGRAAIAAVVKPDSCADFFFVSKNNGTHEFCPDLTCHNRAVNRWQVEYFRR